MNVAILIPVLDRPHRVAPLVESIKATCDARILFLTSPGYPDELAEIRNAGCDFLEVGPHRRGDYARKINYGYAVTQEELLFLGADDLHFHPGWLEAALAKLAPGIGVIGTQDGGNPRVLRGQHSTHSLVTREYADEFGTIDQPGAVLHEKYPHEFLDDELIETAKSRNAFAFAPESKVEHLHPNWGKAPSDPIYAAQRRRMRDGRRLFLKRRHLWGGDPSAVRH